jgi:sugar lactone lactonase YvrE
MKARLSFIAFSLLASAQLSLPAHAQNSFSTLVFTPLTIEGLTGDNRGNLYVAGRNPGVGSPCPVWRINLANPTLVLVGNIPPRVTTPASQCSPSGLTFDRLGNLYVTETDQIYRLFPNSSAPPTATVFATGVLGTNGLAFDRDGNLWTGDGTQGNGRVWRIPPTGGVGVEKFRVQPMASDVNAVAGVGGVGRDVRSLPQGQISFVAATPRTATNTASSQPLVANGVAFDRDGALLILDTARGAVWRAEVDRNGDPVSPVGCDGAFSANTLCLDNVLIAHPLLEGADGFVLDQAGNMYIDANERNAIVVVDNNLRATELFRNDQDPTTHLRNTGPLETPTSPFIDGQTLCTSNSDGNRRDNSPSSAGELPATALGKISCMDQRVNVPGLPLPVR